MNKLFKGLAMAAMVMALGACGSDDDPAPGTTQTGSDAVAPPGPAVAGNAIETASAVANLSTLVRAVEAAGLTATLSQAGDYTVIAPNNAAFESLYSELGVTEQALFANTELLAGVLRYHVANGRVPSTAIQLGKAVMPLAGGVFKFEATSEPLPQIFDGRARSSKVVTVDIETANAVVHVVDKVLLPANKNVVEYVQSQNNLSLLAEAVVAADLAVTLSGAGPFTLLAPTNPAFESLLTELGQSKEELFADKVLLTQVLLYHVIPGQKLRADIELGSVVTQGGGTILVEDNNGGILPKFKDERGRETPLSDRYDLITTNGVVHEIGAVLLPAAPAPAPQ